MNRPFFIALLFFSSTFVLNAQEENFFWSTASIINDKDGYTKLRELPDSKSKIVGKLENGNVFWVMSDPQNDMVEAWYNTHYRRMPKGYLRSETSAKGYIPLSKASPISGLTQLKKHTMFNHGLTLHGDSLAVIFKVRPFNEAEHKVKWYSEGGVEKIDGGKPWGVVDSLPKMELISISIIKTNGSEHEEYNLPQSSLKNIYEPESTKGLGAYVGLNGELLIIMNNGDGAGGYTVCWTLVDMKLKKMGIIRLF